MMFAVYKVLIYCPFTEKEAEWKTFYWIIVILSSPAQEREIIAIDSFPDTATHNSHFHLKAHLEQLETARLIPAPLANLNTQILVLRDGEQLNSLIF